VDELCEALRRLKPLAAVDLQLHGVNWKKLCTLVKQVPSSVDHLWIYEDDPSCVQLDRFFEACSETKNLFSVSFTGMLEHESRIKAILRGLPRSPSIQYFQLEDVQEDPIYNQEIEQMLEVMKSDAAKAMLALCIPATLMTRRVQGISWLPMDLLKLLYRYIYQP
jgi:hypothetical protein